MMTPDRCVFDIGWLAVFKVGQDHWSLWLFGQRYLLQRKVYWRARVR